MRPRQPVPLQLRLPLLALLALGVHGQASAQDALLARNLAATCANCHGTDGRSVGLVKPLAGVPAALQLAALADFRSGAQPATVMHQIVKGYSDEQLKLIADWFAAQKARP